MMEGSRMTELSDIQRFYKDTTVFLTGATGFLGKLLLEKILRGLPVKKVYILIRSKKDVAAEKRMQEIFESPAFEPLKRSDPDALKKVDCIEGDCTLPNLGMSDHDMDRFLKEVSVIFHCAATVRFDEALRKAVITNIRATKDLVDLAKQMKQLKTFVYVGTGYSNSNRSEIQEMVYPSRISAENLIRTCESLDDECLSSLTKTLIADWPNTYTFTKQVAEDYINREGKQLPISIARPTIVISTAEEPIKGFVDSMFTLAGFTLACAMGFIRISYYKNIIVDIVPADYVINECIAIGWHTGETFNKRKEEIPVYNISSGSDNPIWQDDVYGLLDYNCRQIPSPKMLTFPIYFNTTCKYNYLFWRFFMHTLLAYVMDLVLAVKGKKTMYVEGVEKLHNFQAVYDHFTRNNFFIHVGNTHKLLKRMSFRDRELFNFDISRLDWIEYFLQYPKGLRTYLLKDPMETLPEGRKRYAYLRNVMIVSSLFAAIVLYVIGKIVLFRGLPLVIGMISYLLRTMVCQ